MSRHHNERSSHQKRAIKRLILERDGNRCCWCRVPLSLDTATLEHMKPASEFTNGRDRWDPRNMKVACRPCNQNRGTMPADAYADLLKLAAKAEKFVPPTPTSTPEVAE